VSSASSLPPLSAGRQLGDKFEILGVLGEGGMGIVYDARRIGHDDRVALKVIHQHLAGDTQIRGRFTREAAILRRLEGEHLCPILDFGEVEDPRGTASLLFLALPRIDGPALDALLRSEKLLPIARAVAIVLDVCEGLSEAHAQGIIHRDLKPGNVLLRDGDKAMVVDFGMAKIMTGGGTGTTALTQNNMVFGTPEYMAPEQARGDELDARCDVYAAGIILYEVLTGTVPFRGATALSVLTAHLTEPAQRPRERTPDRGISPALEAVVMSAIAKDPRDRYPTAGALAAAIRAAMAAPIDVAAVTPPKGRTEAVDAHAPTIPSPLWGPRRGEAAGVPSEPAPDSHRRAESRVWLLVSVVAAIAGIALGAWLSTRGGP
jgi:serine/threonine-protein kinase